MSKCSKRTLTLKEAKEENVKMYFRKKGRGGSYYMCENCGWYHMTRHRWEPDGVGDEIRASIERAKRKAHD